MHTPKSARSTVVPAYRPIPRVGQGAPAGATSAGMATRLVNDTGVDYPVSGDETLRAYGYVGIRQRHVNIWHGIELGSILA